LSWSPFGFTASNKYNRMSFLRWPKWLSVYKYYSIYLALAQQKNTQYTASLGSVMVFGMFRCLEIFKSDKRLFGSIDRLDQGRLSIKQYMKLETLKS